MSLDAHLSDQLDYMNEALEKARANCIEIPEALHPSTKRLVLEFAAALAVKLRAAEEKYGHRDGWLVGDWEAECRQHLREHLEKGDPLDVAAYVAFMWKRGWPTGSGHGC